ncbi:MAG: hypothetical protein JNG88_14005 [Phycisphaerales bacterium]|nr:hypothetical protein [Phycisphaerales bacterium]
MVESTWPGRAEAGRDENVGAVVNPGSLKSFYRARSLLIAIACIAPLLVLGGAWWLIAEVLLAPGIPTEASPPEDCVAYVVHDKGLRRLSPAEQEKFVRGQMARWLAQPAYREQFAAALRRSTADEQQAFRSNLFDVFKPHIMRDVAKFHATSGDGRRAFLDDRIIEYNRMGRVLRAGRVDKSAFGDALPSPKEMMDLIIVKTTQQERDQAQAFFTAMGGRIAEILADEPLKTEFEAKIAAP